MSSGRAGPRALGAPHRTRLLLLGPLPITGDVIGGAKVVFARTVERFRESGKFELRVVNTSRPFSRWRSDGPGLGRLVLNLAGLVRVLWILATSGRRSDVVMFNGSSRGILLAGPLVCFLCRLIGRPLVFRLFGAGFGRFYDRGSGLRRWLVRRTVLRSDLVLFETAGLCRRFALLATTRRFANTRDVDLASLRPEQPASRSGEVRFAFVAQLRIKKGLQLALDASDHLPPGCTLDFYGPVLPEVDLALFERHDRASYCGRLDPEDVPARLATYDALVFPTLYATEGIPGVILEAMQCGVPVIASRWDAADELIEDGVAGLLVTRGSTQELTEAMTRFVHDDVLRRRLALGARQCGAKYRSGPWHEVLEGWLDEVAA